MANTNVTGEATAMEGVNQNIPIQQNPNKRQSSTEHDDLTENKKAKTADTSLLSKIWNAIQSHTKTLDEIKEHIDKHHTYVKELSTEVTTLHKKVYVLEKENERLDMELRKKNLIFLGVEDKSTESPDECYKKIHDIIEKHLELTNITIDTCHRLSKHQTGKNRPIKVQFLMNSDRNLVLSKRMKLANRQNPKKIFINEDLPLNIRQARNLLREKLKEAIRNGKPAKIDYAKNCVVVDGETYLVKNNKLESSSTATVTKPPSFLELIQ